MFRYLTLLLILVLSINSLNAEKKIPDINPIEFGLYLLDQPTDQNMKDVCQSMGFSQIKSSHEDEMKRYLSPDGLTVSIKCSTIYPVVIISTKSKLSHNNLSRDLLKYNFKEVKLKSSKEKIFINGTSFSPKRTECRIENNTITFSKKEVVVE